MSRGWAYVGCDIGATGSGPTGALQYLTHDMMMTGTSRLIFLTSSDPHVFQLTGTLDVSGAVYAQDLYVTNLNHVTVTTLSSSGDSIFGDTSGDLHQFTGTLSVGGAISGTTKASARYFSSSGDVGSTFGGETLFSSPNSSIKASGSISASVNLSASGHIAGQSVEVDQGGNVYFRGTGGNSKIGCQGGTNLNIRADANIILNNETSGAAKIVARHFSSSGDLGSTFGGETLFSSPNSSIKASGSITASANLSASGRVEGQAGIFLGVTASTIFGASTLILGGNCEDSIYFSSSVTASCGINLCPDAILSCSYIQACSPLSISASSIAITGNLILSGPTTSVSGASGSFTTLSCSYVVGNSQVILGQTCEDSFVFSGSLTASCGIVGDRYGNPEFLGIHGSVRYSSIRPTGTINAAQTGFMALTDMYVNCSGGGVVTLELPRLGTGTNDVPSGGVYYIKRRSSGDFGPMTHNVKITASYPSDTIDGYGEVYLETAGASLQLISSGTDWQIF